MSAVADELARDTAARSRAMTAAERMDEALALGDAAVALHASANGLALPEALRRLERAAQKGRRPSRVMTAIVG